MLKSPALDRGVRVRRVPSMKKLLLALLVGTLLIGCGGDEVAESEQESDKRKDFTGTWSSYRWQTTLVMEQNGSSLVGTYQQLHEGSTRRGRIEGSVDGQKSILKWWEWDHTNQGTSFDEANGWGHAEFFLSEDGDSIRGKYTNGDAEWLEGWDFVRKSR